MFQQHTHAPSMFGMVADNPTNLYENLVAAV
jgi:hypothetical protein